VKNERGCQAKVESGEEREGETTRWECFLKEVKRVGVCVCVCDESNKQQKGKGVNEGGDEEE
jgi:hypothetical protein